MDVFFIKHPFFSGTTALFISAKYEEIYPPDINEFVYITDDSYDKHQILNMEKLILKVIALITLMKISFKACTNIFI